MDSVAASALIFDLDGTVWDSAGWFALGLVGDDALTVAALRNELIVGGNIVGVLRRLRKSREFLLRHALRLGGPPPLFDGMAEALAKLRARRTRLAVATNLPGTIAIPMLEAARLTDTFDAIVHAGMCRIGKPSPASIRMALRLIGQSPSSGVFYVGDRRSDATAASAAGIGMAWMTHGYEQPEPEFGAIAITPAELLAL